MTGRISLRLNLGRKLPAVTGMLATSVRQRLPEGGSDLPACDKSNPPYLRCNKRSVSDLCDNENCCAAARR
jgi:hypothetical protein